MGLFQIFIIPMPTTAGGTAKGIREILSTINEAVFFALCIK